MFFGRICNWSATRAIVRSRHARSKSPGVATPGLWLAMLVVLLTWSGPAFAQRRVGTIFPERRSIEVREPHQLPRYQMPAALTPSTVSRPLADLEPQLLALDGAIRTSMRNLDVVRVLSGVTATNSGRSIYDIALTHTQIDQQQARFDPLLSVNNSWNVLENPQAIFDPLPPHNPLITGTQTRNFNTSTRLSKTDLTGGNFVLGVDATPSHTHPGTFPLDPLTRSSTFVSYTQPLLKGGGIEFNLAPIVIAEISTERSYFQFKDAMQEHVRGVIEAYWSLVAARTDLWARKQQAEQLTANVRLIDARFRGGFDNRADLAQVQVALANTKASVVTAQGNVLLREAALRNMIGVSPSDGTLYIPTTPPINERFIPDWDQMLQLAEERRPDLIELKLILEADTQQLLIARNSSRPQLDAVALYRWNGLSGNTPTGSRRSTSPGQYTDWTLGVNFSVPLGLRQARATVRQQELVIARDQINLKQGFHATTHILAATVRTLDQQYEQYLAFREARQAARVNLNYQLIQFRSGRTIPLNVLLAISDWGNTVSAEASALTQYNTQLATLERQTGTILETHGIYFVQESQQAIGPHGRFCDTRCYPRDTRPTENRDLYEDSTEPAENSFDLTPPPNMSDAPPAVPFDQIKLPTLEEIMRQQKDRDAEPPPP